MSSALDDPRRLDAVWRSSMVGSTREPIFDELTKAAAHLMRAPYALMSIMDDTDSFWKSSYGLPISLKSEPVAESFCQYVVSSGEDLLTADVRANEITRDNPTIEAKGVRAWAGTSIELDGQTLGTLCVIDSAVRTWTVEDHNILRSLAAIASREITLRAELASFQAAAVSAQSESDRMRALLDTIRTSLLPPTIPSIPRVDLATWFEAADDGDMLLGDFYDVFASGPHCWSVVVGDVCGHGVEAAKLTSLVRYSLRAAALHHSDLAAMMDEVDRAIRLDELDVGRFATVCYFEIDTTSDVQIRWARAGHPHPLLIDAGGVVREVLGADGPPLGLSTSSRWITGAFELLPGETVVLYTDGVTESRVDHTGERLHVDGLIDILQTCTCGISTQAQVEHLVNGLHHACSHCDDDRAIVAITHTKP